MCVEKKDEEEKKESFVYFVMHMGKERQFSSVQPFCAGRLFHKSTTDYVNLTRKNYSTGTSLERGRNCTKRKKEIENGEGGQERYIVS